MVGSWNASVNGIFTEPTVFNRGAPNTSFSSNSFRVSADLPADTADSNAERVKRSESRLFGRCILYSMSVSAVKRESAYRVGVYESLL